MLKASPWPGRLWGAAGPAGEAQALAHGGHPPAPPAQLGALLRARVFLPPQEFSQQPIAIWAFPVASLTLSFTDFSVQRGRVQGRAFQHRWPRASPNPSPNPPRGCDKGQMPACAKVGRPSGALAHPPRPLSSYSWVKPRAFVRVPALPIVGKALPFASYFPTLLSLW